jgi:HlyD family secretion protein
MVAPVLFELVQNLDKMRVDVNLDESDVGQVTTGQPAAFTVDSFPGRTFRAAVREVRHEAINVQNVISYDVVLDVVDPGVQLLPGMTAKVSIRTADRQNVVKVPNGALRFRPDDVPTKLGSAVYTLGQDNHPIAHQVRTGITDGRFTELLSGDLKDGDAVVVAESD